MSNSRSAVIDLRAYERAVVFIFLSGLFLLSLFALRAPEERWPHAKYPERKKQFVVTISGDVQNEGRYHFEQGTTLREALQGLVLKPEEQKHLKLDHTLKPGQKIRIKTKKSKKDLKKI